MVRVKLDIQGHSENILLYVTSLAYFDIVLGLPWLQYHNPEIRWAEETLQFKDQGCKKHIAKSTSLVYALSPNYVRLRRQLYSTEVIDRTSDTEICNPDDFSDSIIKGQDTVMTISIEDIEEALKEKLRIDPAEKLPEIYHEYLAVFSKDEADKLPPHRPCDHRIILKPGLEPPWGPLYGMSREELEVLKKYLKENLEKGFIRPSSSPASSPVLFVKKPGGGLRFCVDYRALNEITIKNRYPIPRIHETLSLLGRAKYFTKLDVISAFNRLRIAKGDEYLTAFRTRFGLYEYIVMPFGLANALSSFQNYINDTLRGYLDEFCTAYIDDILIFSETLEDHQSHVKKVLARLMEAGLQIDIKKCDFHVKYIKFLGLVITTKGIKMDPSKLKVIEEWKPPESTKEVFRFVRFINFYRRFICKFGSIIMPLTDLMKRDIPFSWGLCQQKAFDLIKSKFREDVVLKHFDWDKPARLETDASDRGTGGVLLQPDDTAIVQAFEGWRPELEGSPDPVEVVTDHKALEYFMKSRLLSRRQARWSEFLSRFNFIISYRPGTQNGPADALSRPNGLVDPSLKGFLEQRLLKPQNLSPGMGETQLLANELVEERVSSMKCGETADSDENILLEALTFVDRVRRAAMSDESIASVVKALQDQNAPRVRDFTLSECVWDNGLLYYRNNIVVPQCSKDETLTTEIIKSYHDSPASGHQGAAATYSAITRTFFWNGILQQVRRFVKNCHICSRTKPSREGTQGLLRPLPIAKERWRHVALDFIVDLPPSQDWNNQEYDSMLVIVDRMTKQVHIVPCNDLTARNTAYMFCRECFRLHGLPNSIVSDRGTQFTSEFWKWLCKLLQIDHHLSTAYHPQTDGQIERMNARVEQYLRAYVNYAQNDWIRYLPSAEFALNDHDSQVTGVSPFMAVYGLHPRSGNELSAPLSGPPVPSSLRFDRLDAENLVQNAKKIEKILRIASRNFKAGDLVWLNYKHIKTLRPSKKLDFKKGGPFKIIEPIGKYAFKLEIPSSAKIHPVFHVSLLSPVASDPLPGQDYGPPPLLEAENDDSEYEVEKVIGSYWENGQFFYLVRWKGYGPEDDWGIPASQTEGFKDLVNEFHELNPSEAKPSDPPPKHQKKNKKPRRSSARRRGG
ncbi:hypothetical protein K3495_g11272 [Podosphaera aphanis]|nr:hypothetical protein K3495_g11272 [Podosphaera aphanis]